MNRLNTPRELRGLAILSKGNSITQLKRNTYEVKSQTGIGDYRIYLNRRKWYCSCPDFKEHQTDCKHIFAVKFSRKLKTEVEKDYELEAPKEVEFKPANCPSCNHENVIKSGVRKTQRGDVQRYHCKDCGHRFTIDKGFSRMKHDPKAITLTMDLYFKDVSYRKITDHLKQFYNLKVAPSTPMRWVKKYLKLLSKYSEQYKADVGNVWHSDEMTVNIKKKGEKGYREWIWNIMDANTRYLLACRITKKRYVKDAQGSLRDAKRRSNKRPDIIVTDGLHAYQSAIPNEFYKKGADIENPHLRLKDFQTKPNNNIVERLNGTYRERLKVMRGLNDPVNANEFVEAMQVYYNYIRPHQALNGHTLAEMAHIPIDLDGNRWLKMIELATTQKNI